MHALESLPHPSWPSSSFPNTHETPYLYDRILQSGELLPLQIYYACAGGTLTLTWLNGGSLLASPAAAGTYTNVPGAVSPWPITPMSEPSMFYRVQQP